MNKEKILLIGPPGSGKTTLINSLIQKNYICYPEISREITLKAQRNGIDQLFLEQPLLFSQMLLDARIKQFEDASKEEAEIIFIDRGIPDILAYMTFIGDNDIPLYFKEACKKHIYDKIFVLPPWEKIYQNDEARYESFEQAQEIYIHLINTYKHYGYDLIDVPMENIDNRIEFILNKIHY